MKEKTLNYDVLTYEDGNVFESVEDVVEEKRYQIIVNEKIFYNLTCSPFNVLELLVGNMWMRNLIDSKDDIKSIDIGEEIIKVFLNIETKNKNRDYKFVKSPLTLPKEKVPKLMKKLQERANLFSRTGGVHNAGLCDGEEIILFMEDIGRHNTVDKLMGYCILNEIDISDKIIVFSGRIPFEIINKLSMMAVPIFISKSAPTSLGVDMARKYNITICGFTRGERYHIYSCPERLV